MCGLSCICLLKKQPPLDAKLNVLPHILNAFLCWKCLLIPSFLYEAVNMRLLLLVLFHRAIEFGTEQFSL